MGAKLDLRGQKFGRWTVLEEAGRKCGGVLWRCQCDCGTIREVTATHLRAKNSVSCGCYSKEIHTKHRKSRGSIYHVWQCMKDRCFNPNAQEAKHYIEKGISVCDEWLDFDNFYKWAVANGYKKGLSLDRIDNDGNYEPSNCRWATPKMQARNRSNNVHLTWQGETHCVSEWAEILGLNPITIFTRLSRGWSVDDALGRAVCR